MRRRARIFLADVKLLDVALALTSTDRVDGGDEEILNEQRLLNARNLSDVCILLLVVVIKGDKILCFYIKRARQLASREQLFCVLQKNFLTFRTQVSTLARTRTCP